MPQLTKGMYGTKFWPASNNHLFGLCCEQMRSRPAKVIHNAGWYNKSGEKLGWGDLDTGDFARICRGLELGELFIILSEHNSFWSFVTDNSGIIGGECKTSPDMEAPGVDYVAKRCHYIIAPGELYSLDVWESAKDGVIDYHGARFKVLTREAATALIKGTASPA